MLSEMLQYGMKSDAISHHGKGELCVQISIDSLAAPEHAWVKRDTLTHCAGSCMFPHETAGNSNIYCVRHQTIPGDADIYAYLIKPMAVATEQQIMYGRAYSDAKIKN